MDTGSFWGNENKSCVQEKSWKDWTTHMKKLMKDRKSWWNWSMKETEEQVTNSAEEEIKTQETHLTTSPSRAQSKWKNWKKDTTRKELLQRIDRKRQKERQRERKRDRKKDRKKDRNKDRYACHLSPDIIHCLCLPFFPSLPDHPPHPLTSRGFQFGLQTLHSPCITSRYSQRQFLVIFSSSSSFDQYFGEGKSLEMLSLPSTLSFLVLPVYLLCRHQCI